MFEELKPVLDKVNLHLDISCVGDSVAVTIHCLPKKKSGDKDEPPLHTVPFVLHGTLKELDKGFRNAIEVQLGKIVPFATNAEAFAKDLTEQAARQATEKETKAKAEVVKKDAEAVKKGDKVDISKWTAAEKTKYTKMNNAIKEAAKKTDIDMVNYMRKESLKIAAAFSTDADKVVAEVNKAYDDIVSKFSGQVASPAEEKEAEGIFGAANKADETEEADDDAAADADDADEPAGDDIVEAEEVPDSQEPLPAKAADIDEIF